MAKVKNKPFYEKGILGYFLKNKSAGQLVFKFVLMVILFEANAFLLGYLHSIIPALSKHIIAIAVWVLGFGVLELIVFIWAVVRFVNKKKVK